MARPRSAVFERTDQRGFLAGVPHEVSGIEITRICFWIPGGPGGYATATVIGFRRHVENGPWSTHVLIAQDDVPNAPRWTLERSHYNLSSERVALLDIGKRIAGYLGMLED